MEKQEKYTESYLFIIQTKNSSPFHHSNTLYTKSQGIKNISSVLLVLCQHGFSDSLQVEHICWEFGGCKSLHNSFHGVRSCIVFFFNHTFQLQHPSLCTALSQTGWNTLTAWWQLPQTGSTPLQVMKAQIWQNMMFSLVKWKLSWCWKVVTCKTTPPPVLQASYVAKVSHDHVQEPSCMQCLQKQSSSWNEKIGFIS